MSEELYFNNELRKCLNAAGLSDCGENDAWNYWYHRVHKAHDQAVDRVTEAQRAENAKLRELAEKAWKAAERLCQAFDGPCRDDGVTTYKPCPMGERDEECVYGLLQRDLRELGVEVDDGLR